MLPISRPVIVRLDSPTIWQKFPAIDVRLQLQEDIEQLTSAFTKQKVVDAIIRLTWQVGR